MVRPVSCLMLAAAAAPALAWAPDRVHEALKGVTFSGGLANPLTEFPEARWERRLATSVMPHERYTELQVASKTDDSTQTPAERNTDASGDALGDDYKDASATTWTTKAGGTAGADDTDDAPCNDDDGPCDALPTEFSWYSFHGVGLLTHNLNQHLPTYCADCWLASAAAMIADRIKIARYAMGAALGPDINIAMQTVLNCGQRIAGNCASGTLHGVFDYIEDANGIPYDTCMNYEADDSKGCSAPTYCKSCKATGDCFGVPAMPAWDPHGRGFWFNGVPKVELQEWGYIGTLLNNTVRDIQIEVATRGPVACMVDPVPLNAYKEGVIDASWDAQVGYAHVLEIVGWGEKDGEKFWHVRNSWGEYWGERGFGRVLRDDDSSTAVGSIGIQGMCSWAVPNKWGQVMKSMGDNMNAKKDSKSKSVEHYGNEGGTVAANDTVYDDQGGPGDRTGDIGDDGANASSTVVNAVGSDSMYDKIMFDHAGEWDRVAVETLWKRAGKSKWADLAREVSSGGAAAAALVELPDEYIAPSADAARAPARVSGAAALAAASTAAPAASSESTWSAPVLAGVVAGVAAVFAGGFLSGSRFQKGGSSYAAI